MTSRTRPAARRAPAIRDPDRTREQILAAAQVEFAREGLGGARVDAIAKRAGANKRMLYHYFGDKKGLYLAVLERVYAAKREEERRLDIGNLGPEAAIAALVRFNFDYCIAHPEFINLLNTENLHRARHLARSRKVRQLYSPLVDTIAGVLQRGVAAGVFRSGVDPIQLYITIASLGYFYRSNQWTLSAIFSRDFATLAARTTRRAFDVELVLGFLRAGAVRV